MYEDITQTIGQTPLVRSSRLTDKYSVKAQILAKIEYFNTADAVKDSPAMAMIEALIASEISILRLKSSNQHLAKMHWRTRGSGP